MLEMWFKDDGRVKLLPFFSTDTVYSKLPWQSMLGALYRTAKDEVVDAVKHPTAKLAAENFFRMHQYMKGRTNIVEVFAPKMTTTTDRYYYDK